MPLTKSPLRTAQLRFGSNSRPNKTQTRKLTPAAHGKAFVGVSRPTTQTTTKATQQASAKATSITSLCQLAREQVFNKHQAASAMRKNRPSKCRPPHESLHHTVAAARKTSAAVATISQSRARVDSISNRGQRRTAQTPQTIKTKNSKPPALVRAGDKASKITAITTKPRGACGFDCCSVVLSVGICLCSVGRQQAKNQSARGPAGLAGPQLIVAEQHFRSQTKRCDHPANEASNIHKTRSSIATSLRPSKRQKGLLQASLKEPDVR